jgi:ketosteroid isomerase-like protein
MRRPQPDPIDDQGKYLVIFQRQADGSWRVARDMDNSNGRAAPNTDEAG